jgi:hypothetical protein
MEGDQEVGRGYNRFDDLLVCGIMGWLEQAYRYKKYEFCLGGLIE